jgi:small subunit ribosomal protein S15
MELRYETSEQLVKLMAKMHSRRKGKSGSKRPAHATIPEWVTQTKEEVEAKIVDLAKQGLSSAEIGMTLRDSYGIPSVKLCYKEKIVDVMKREGVYPEYPEDFRNLVRKALALRRHLDGHPKDKHSQYGLQKIESKIRRLLKYYQNNGVISKSFKYDPKTAATIIR